ncbi:hypothetical protein NDU88_008382 [Pleurodeles waltl]|uniref:Uncharacterized protein n=1 Tax=Pleurodeles waltl TaxID=8319 RepID=A0AAV7QSN3_PLEWA|nr:hypothetical protein NDU88_008382 [Pleurodeles waltl]
MQSCAQASLPPSRPGGRFRHRAHFAVTRGALSRLAPSYTIISLDKVCPTMIISAGLKEVGVKEYTMY